MAERGIDAPLDEIAPRAGVGRRRCTATSRIVMRSSGAVRAGVAELHDLASEIVGAETGWRSVELYLERLGAWVADQPYLPAVIAASPSSTRLPARCRFEEMIDGLVARAQAEGRSGPT